MTTHITTSMIDDIDGSEDAQTTTFAFDGKSYSIDLGERNLARLTKALAPFIAKATRDRSNIKLVTTMSRADRMNGFVPADIRAWALSHGLYVGAKGRIPGPILDKYRADRGH